MESETVGREGQRQVRDRDPGYAAHAPGAPVYVPVYPQYPPGYPRAVPPAREHPAPGWYVPQPGLQSGYPSVPGTAPGYRDQGYAPAPPADTGNPWAGDRSYWSSDPAYGRDRRPRQGYTRPRYRPLDGQEDNGAGRDSTAEPIEPYNRMEGSSWRPRSDPGIHPGYSGYYPPYGGYGYVPGLAPAWPPYAVPGAFWPGY